MWQSNSIDWWFGVRSCDNFAAGLQTAKGGYIHLTQRIKKAHGLTPQP